MTLAFTPPPRTVSPLSRLDPRWKLAAITLAGLVAAVVHTPAGAAAAVAGVLCWPSGGGCPGDGAGSRRSGPVLLFVALFAVPLIFLPANAASVWRLGPAALSVPGAATAVVLFCKAAALVLLALVVLATAPLDATLKAGHALCVPGLLVQLALLSYRYLFVLADELGRLRTALRVRGYRNRANLHSYRIVGAVTGALLVRRLGARRARGSCHALSRFRRSIPFTDRVPYLCRRRVDVFGCHRRRGGRLCVGLGEINERLHERFAVSADPAIQVSELTYAYPQGPIALDRLTFDIAVGENVALIGPNGALAKRAYSCVSAA